MTDPVVYGSAVFIDPETGTELTIRSPDADAPSDADLRAVAKALVKDPDATTVNYGDSLAQQPSRQFTITRSGPFGAADASRLLGQLLSAQTDKPVTPGVSVSRPPVGFQAQKLPLPVTAWDPAKLTDDQIDALTLDDTVRVGPAGAVVIRTLEGETLSRREDIYIIRGSTGEFWPIQKRIFDQTYERL